MVLYGFNILSINEQMEVVNKLGTFIDNHIEIKEHCNLYAVGMFYVEAVYKLILTLFMVSDFSSNEDFLGFHFTIHIL